MQRGRHSAFALGAVWLLRLQAGSVVGASSISVLGNLVIRPFPWSGMAMEIGGAGWAIRNENQNVLAGCAMNLGSSDDKQRCHVFSQISLFLES